MQEAIHRINVAYWTGLGKGFTPVEEELLSRRVFLTERRIGLRVNRLQCNQLEVINMFSQAPVLQIY